MRYRPLGRSGPLVSEVGLGANNFGGRLDDRASAAVIHRALDLGVNLIDTADIYNAGRSEEVVGAALRGRRDEVVLATKVGMASEEGDHGGGLSAPHVRRIVERSLRRLGTDRIDLLQLHVPDPWTPLEETLGVLDELRRSGVVLHVGSTNFWAWEVAEAVTLADAHGWPRLVSASSEWSLVHREPERELVPAAARLGVGILPYRPLAQGFLTGKYAAGARPSAGSRFDRVPQQGAARLTAGNFDALERIGAFAAARGLEVAGVAFAYLLAHREVSSVLVGASTPEQVATNVASASAVLTAADVEEVRTLIPGLGGHLLGLPHLRPVAPGERPTPG